MYTHKIKNTRRHLTENIVSLGFLQSISYILPLMTLPYLVRLLGPDKFGLVVFSQAFIFYFVIITNYSFNYTATRDISINRNNKEKVSEIFCSAMIIKFGLLIFSLLLMSLIIFSVPRFYMNREVYFVSSLAAIGNMLFPSWFFQGMERIKYLTLLNICAKLLTVGAIFIFVKNPSDHLLAAWLLAAWPLVAGILAQLSILISKRIRYIIPPRKILLKMTVEGWPVFLSTVTSSVYNDSTPLILGLLTNNTAVGIFVAAEKIVKAVQLSFTPIFQTIFPHISALAAQSRETAERFISRSIRWIAGLSLAASFGLLLAAGPLGMLILGQGYEQSIMLIRLMSFLPFISAINNMLGIQTMLTFGMNRLFCRILIAAALISIAIIVPLALSLGANGAAIALVLTEIFVMVSFAISLKKRGFRVFGSFGAEA